MPIAFNIHEFLKRESVSLYLSGRKHYYPNYLRSIRITITSTLRLYITITLLSIPYIPHCIVISTYITLH